MGMEIEYNSMAIVDCRLKGVRWGWGKRVDAEIYWGVYFSSSLVCKH